MAAIASATPVLAATAADMEKGGKQHLQQAKEQNDCLPLEAKFDAAYGQRNEQAYAGDAKAMRDLGAQRCDNGDSAQGISDLLTALHELGLSGS